MASWRDLKKASAERARSEHVVFQDRSRRIRRGRSVSRRHRSPASRDRARIPRHAIEVRRSCCCSRRGTKSGCWRCFILVGQYARADTRTRQTIHQLYLRNTRSINNWDLVDSSAAQIVGAHLETRRSPRAAPSCPIEIRMGTAHRDDRDVSLHPPERVQRRARPSPDVLRR